MEVIKFERLFQKNFDKRDNFKHLADYIVAHHTRDLDDERKIDVSADTALGMALGEAITKNKYLLTGMTIGSLGTIGALSLYNKFKKRKEVRVNVGELVEMTEHLMEFEKEKLNEE